MGQWGWTTIHPFQEDPPIRAGSGHFWHGVSEVRECQRIYGDTFRIIQEHDVGWNSGGGAGGGFSEAVVQKGVIRRMEAHVDGAEGVALL